MYLRIIRTGARLAIEAIAVRPLANAAQSPRCWIIDLQQLTVVQDDSLRGLFGPGRALGPAVLVDNGLAATPSVCRLPEHSMHEYGSAAGQRWTPAVSLRPPDNTLVMPMSVGYAHTQHHVPVIFERSPVGWCYAPAVIQESPLSVRPLAWAVGRALSVGVAEPDRLSAWGAAFIEPRIAVTTEFHPPAAESARATVAPPVRSARFVRTPRVDNAVTTLPAVVASRARFRPGGSITEAAAIAPASPSGAALACRRMQYQAMEASISVAGEVSNTAARSATRVQARPPQAQLTHAMAAAAGDQRAVALLERPSLPKAGVFARRSAIASGRNRPASVYAPPGGGQDESDVDEGHGHMVRPDAVGGKRPEQAFSFEFGLSLIRDSFDKPQYAQPVSRFLAASLRHILRRKLARFEDWRLLRSERVLARRKPWQRLRRSG